MENNLSLNAQAVAALRESAKWSLFLSIIGFIGIGFLLIAAAIVGFAMSRLEDVSPGFSSNPFITMKGFVSVIYVVIAILYFFPIYYLYKYASGAKNALQTYNSEQLSDALVNLKSHHKFLGITVIVIISLYIFMFVGVLIAVSSFA